MEPTIFAQHAVPHKRLTNRVNTGDDLLAVFDAVSNVGFSLEKLSKAIVPISDKLGIIMLSEREGVVQAEISASISGQWYDWGKSQALIDAVCTNISRDLADQQTGKPPHVAKVA